MKLEQLINKDSLDILSEVTNQYDKHVENLSRSRSRLKKFKELKAAQAYIRNKKKSHQ